MKVKAYTPELLSELRFEARALRCNIPGSVKEFVADYALLGNENSLLNYNNGVIDLLEDVKMEIVLALGEMVEKVAGSPDGEAKQFWAKQIRRINDANGELTHIERFFWENESVVRRMGKDYFDLLQNARRDRAELDALKEVLKQMEELNQIKIQ